MSPISFCALCIVSFHSASLLFDREIGKPKGYGFCEFAGTSCVSPSCQSTLSFSSDPCPPEPQDHDTAMSAVRNLNGADVCRRPLRIGLADSDPFLEGKTTMRGELVDSGGPDNRRSREKDDHGDRRRGPGSRTNSFLADLPPGIPIPPGSTALDTISRSLTTMEPCQLLEVLAQMKVCT
jgi:cleavage stimulation factor subunit 2